MDAVYHAPPADGLPPEPTLARLLVTLEGLHREMVALEASSADQFGNCPPHGWRAGGTCSTTSPSAVTTSARSRTRWPNSGCRHSAAPSPPPWPP